MDQINLTQANTVVGAAFEFAEKSGFKALAAVVVDAGGHMITFQRQDGAAIGRLWIAMGKAGGALALGQSSRKISDMAAERPAFVASLAGAIPGGVIAAAGGVLVSNEDGRVIGAVGISGDLSDNDEAAALVGIEAAGLTPKG